MNLRYACVAVGVLSLISAGAKAASITQCSLNSPNAGFTCNIFESLANGTPSEISGVFTLPNAVTAGYIVLLDNASSVRTDNTQWSDVLKFIDNSQGVATTFQLLSAGCNNAAAPFSCFPTFAVVNAAPNAFLVEPATGPTVFSATPNTYNIFSDPGVITGTTPEPASLWLGLGGFALLAMAKNFQRDLRERAPDA